MSALPSSWPVVVHDANGWPVLDRNAVVARARSGALDDDGWAALAAALLALGKPAKKDREALHAALVARMPAASAFEKPISLGKCAAAARAAGLDARAFAMAMALVEPISGVEAAADLVAPPDLFDLVSGWRAITLHVGKALPPGLSRVAALERLTLFRTTKLKSDANTEELANLPNRVFLTLAFEGKPDDMAAPAFFPPSLALFRKTGAGTLAFETTGAPVRLGEPELHPLAGWPSLHTLSLRGTTLVQPTGVQLGALRAALPSLKTLVVAAAPAGWRDAWPGLALLTGSDWRPAA